MTILRGITWDHLRGYGPLIASASAYQSDHPEVEIHWDRRTLQEFADLPIETLVNRYDLLMIDHPFVGAAATNGCLAPLDGLLSSQFLEEQASQSVGPSYASYAYDGHQWALALDAAAQVSAYRPDLIETVPTRWDDVLLLAKERAGDNEPRVGMPLIPVDAICSFFSLCAAWGEPAGTGPDRFVSRDMGLQVLRWLRELVTVMHPTSLASNPPGMLDLMATGDEIAYVPLLFGYSNYARPGYRPHLVRFANIPSLDRKPAGAILGGVGLAISAQSPSHVEAARYGQWLAQPVIQKSLFFEAGGQPGSRAAWLDPAVNRQCSNFFLDTLETLDLAYVRPRHNGYLTFQDTAGHIIHQFLGEGGEPAEVLNQLESAYAKSLSVGEEADRVSL